MAKLLKVARDYIAKKAWNRSDLHPAGLFQLSQYMRNFGAIHFDHHKNADGTITAVSKDFRFGSIITTGKNLAELDKNIQDAILTSFEIPSSYAKEAKIVKIGAEQKEYALA